MHKCMDKCSDAQTHQCRCPEDTNVFKTNVDYICVHTAARSVHLDVKTQVICMNGYAQTATVVISV